LSCHAKANWQRLSREATSNNGANQHRTVIGFLANGDKGLTCTSFCRPTIDPGRDSDLRPTETGVVKTCASCHPESHLGGRYFWC
jgi:hypothetical protein